MYRYDEFDDRFLRERVAQFRDQVSRRLSGSLTEDEFRPLRLQNGLYLQLHAYMLRIAVPYGSLSPRQLRQLALIADRFDKGYGHFTTRQNLQFNWPKLRDVPDILALLADVEMHAIQTSGNCIRNVTADQFAGVARDEIEDPRPVAELLRQWSSLHPEFSFLPRKFKIAVTGAASDRAVLKAHDVGVRILRHPQTQEIGYEILAGGGLGRTPMVGKVVRDFLPRGQLLAYLEALLRVYNSDGRRDNKFKARIKILVHELGLETFREQASRPNSRRAGLVGDETAELARIAAAFAKQSYERCPRRLARFRSRAQACQSCFRRMGRQQPVPASRGRLCGRHRFAEAGRRRAGRHDVGPDARLRRSGRALFARRVARHPCAESRAAACEARRSSRSLADARRTRSGDGQCRPRHRHHRLPRPRLLRAGDRALDPDRAGDRDALRRSARQRDIGPLQIKISGCINACGHHHVGHIGILGLEKRGQESYQVTLGGDGSENMAIGELLGPGLTADEVPDAIERIVGVYLAQRRSGETFIDAVKRLGVGAFKAAFLAGAQNEAA